MSDLADNNFCIVVFTVVVVIVAVVVGVGVGVGVAAFIVVILKMFKRNIRGSITWSG